MVFHNFWKRISDYVVSKGNSVEDIFKLNFASWGKSHIQTVGKEIMPHFSEISKDYLALTFCYFLLLLFFSFKKEINMKHHSDIYKQGSLKK